MSQMKNIMNNMKLHKKWYDKHALAVVNTLQENGFKAYFVGGCVRDLLLGQKPKDFDILTNARPAAISKLFRNSRMIGRRFPIVHVTFGRHFVEITSMMPAFDPWWRRWFSDKFYSSLAEDAARRDFTVNGLYYDPIQEELHDPLDAMKDLKNKKLTMIGPILQRMKEDPVRMLRAIRLAGKTGLTMDQALVDAFPHIAAYLHDESDQRIYLEWVKLVLSGSALPSFNILMATPHCFALMLPSLHEMYSVSIWRRIGTHLIERALRAIDERFHANKTVSLVFALSIFFWLQIDKRVRDKQLNHSESDITQQLVGVMAPLYVPIKIREGIAEIYAMQYAMKNRSTQNVARLIRHPRFRASYDFLMLRASADLKVTDLAQWWYDFVHGDVMAQAYMLRQQDDYHARPGRPQHNKGRRPPQKRRRSK